MKPGRFRLTAVSPGTRPIAIVVPALAAALLIVSGAAAAHDPASLIWPEEITYIGAFRVPQETGAGSGWNYGGGGLAYCPGGEPGGPDDGFPGSLFGVGHDTENEVSEISIPVPLNPPDKDPAALNTAAVLQPFASITGGIFTPSDDGAPLHMDLEYLPAKGDQTSEKIYLVWGEHYQFEQAPSHAWSETCLTAPLTRGPWYIGNYSNFATSDYLFSVPDDWAGAHTGGLSLVTGRFRDGSLGGSGPALFATAPWLDGDPPAPGTTLDAVVPLLLYEKGYEGSRRVMAGYTNADEWSGATWISAGNRSAVIFTGTRGRGGWWYGFANGVVWPEEPPYPPIPPPPNDDRGWWADGFRAVIAFYDPADLAAVAHGLAAPSRPQPYAEMIIDGYLYDISWAKEKRRVGAAAFDPGSGILYISEFRGDGDLPLIHAWKIRADPPGTRAAPSIGGISPASGNPGATTRVWNLAGAGFRPGATVYLTKGGEPRITATAVRVAREDKIKCRIPVPAGARPGLWNVVVRNADGTKGVLRKAFFIG